MCLLLPASAARSAELWSSEGGERYYSLRTSLKWTSLLSHAPEDTVLYPEHWSASGLWRMRLVLEAQPVSWLKAEVAYEQRARLVSELSGAGGGAGVLFSESDAPYRLSQLDKQLVKVGSTFTYAHELDRALVAVRLTDSELTLGRQAVGWGRGVFFGAVDIFVPFTPLESDREWRRGIDAARVVRRLADTISLDAVAALGESKDASSFAARLSGYVGDVDGELIFGKRCEDYVYAASASAPVLEAELHGELAFFKTPRDLPGGGVFGQDDLVAKAVLGGSYSVDVGQGLMLMAEYHFSGFGMKDVQEAAERFADEDFRERYVRGDTQILSRHAVALQGVYGLAAASPFSVSWIMSPVDGSGVLVPSLTWVFSDNVTLIAQAYVPHGPGPEQGLIRSEYGGAPLSGLIQMNFYY
ncbi:MAG: hypothetical protein JSW03_07950 [Candidatus Eiseniibacteriota bacterium]|nr:MAG: hypothetical protein JSW03_07950 [Candidatus Eisenbacteria bacterium]